MIDRTLLLTTDSVHSPFGSCDMHARVRNLNKNRIVSPETCSCSQLWPLGKQAAAKILDDCAPNMQYRSTFRKFRASEGKRRSSASRMAFPSAEFTCSHVFMASHGMDCDTPPSHLIVCDFVQSCPGP